MERTGMMLQLIGRRSLATVVRRSAYRFASTTSTTPTTPTSATSVSLSSSATIRGVGQGGDRGHDCRRSGNDGKEEKEKVETVLGLSLVKGEVNEGLLNALSLENASKKEKQKVAKLSIVEKFKRSESDTGSPEVQIALMTEQIKNLTTHMVEHRKDTRKKRPMDILVGKRRRLMKYMYRTSPERYLKLIRELGLRPNSIFSNDNRKGAKLRPKRSLILGDDEL